MAYRAKKPWEEDEKTEDENPSYQGSQKYAGHTQDGEKDAYNSGRTDEEGSSKVYNAGKGAVEDDKEKKDEPNIVDKVEQEKKYDKKESLEEDIPAKAAAQVFEESKGPEIRKEKGRKTKKSIEEAIANAVEEEKKVIFMD